MVKNAVKSETRAACCMLWVTIAIRVAEDERGRAAIGSRMSVEKNWLPSDVKSSGAVSPEARASAGITPVRMPGAAAGSTTLQIVRQRGAARARAASFWLSGTRRVLELRLGGARVEVVERFLDVVTRRGRLAGRAVVGVGEGPRLSP
jgi:hypothetical protein